MIKRNHSATHLLHAALRKVLGDHISQAGSSVETSRLRFDFTHPKAMSFEEIKEVENLVNFEILKAIPAKTEILELNEAKKSGAIALFGEKYANKVRVLSFGDFSKELCGGTHVKNSSEIGAFLITKESGVSAGVRRIEAICSKEVINYTNHLRDKLETINSELKSNEPLIAIDKLKNEIKELKNELKKTSNNKELEVHNINGVSVIVSEFDGDIKTKIDELKNKYEKVVILLENIKDDKITLCAGVKNAPIKAGDLVKQTALIVGGNGGGRDDFATAGGKDISKSKEALKFGLKYIKEKLS